MTSFWQYKTFWMFESVSQITAVKWGGLVKIDEFAFSRCNVIVSFRNNVDIVVHYDNYPF